MANAHFIFAQTPHASQRRNDPKLLCVGLHETFSAFSSLFRGTERHFVTFRLKEVGKKEKEKKKGQVITSRSTSFSILHLYHKSINSLRNIPMWFLAVTEATYLHFLTINGNHYKTQRRAMHFIHLLPFCL